MPINNLPFIGEEDPVKKAQQIYKKLESHTIDAIFTSEKGSKGEMTRAYVEMVIEDFAIMTQNQALFNKFLQIDTKLEKSLREYQAELKGLLNGIVSTSVAQPSMQQPVQMPVQPQPDTQVVDQPLAPATPTTPKSVGVE